MSCALPQWVVKLYNILYDYITMPVFKFRVIDFISSDYFIKTTGESSSSGVGGHKRGSGNTLYSKTIVTNKL